jgi:hypothetical protein
MDPRLKKRRDFRKRGYCSCWMCKFDKKMGLKRPDETKSDYELQDYSATTISSRGEAFLRQENNSESLVEGSLDHGWREAS